MSDAERPPSSSARWRGVIGGLGVVAVVWLIVVVGTSTETHEPDAPSSDESWRTSFSQKRYAIAPLLQAYLADPDNHEINAWRSHIKVTTAGKRHAVLVFDFAGCDEAFLRLFRRMPTFKQAQRDVGYEELRCAHSSVSLQAME